MSKIGIALAGGGPLGGIYEVGACAALDEAIAGLDLAHVDVYVGVSAGGFIASSLANGISPAQLARILLSSDAAILFDPSLLLRPALHEYASRALTIPKLASRAAFKYLSNPWRYGLVESLQHLTAAMPTGVFDGGGVDAVLRRLFTDAGGTNDFRELKSRLFLIATDLDSGKAVEFGREGMDHVPISTAVQASAALPGLFPPVRIDGHHYVDGALIKTLHASVALREGVDLLLCVNPLVPFNAELAAQQAAGKPKQQLSDGGLPVVLGQTFRAIIRSRMAVGMDHYKHDYPHANVLLFEPAQDDADIFFANMFSYRDRKHLCEHAYQRTRQDLYNRRQTLRPILRKHGLDLDVAALRDHRRTLLRDERGEPKPSSVASTTSALDHALDDLHDWLKSRGAAVAATPA